MTLDIIFEVLLIWHVGSIVAWFGSGILFISVISPSLSKMSPSARGESISMILPRYLDFVTRAGASAVVAGIVLFAYDMYVPSAVLSNSGFLSISIGALLGLIAFIAVLAIARPTGKKMVALMGQMAKSPSEGMAGEMATLHRKLTMGARLGIVFLSLALILMLVGANI
jgi:hypothetical protein